MFADMVRAAAAIDKAGKARAKRGLSEDPRDPKEVHVQEGIHPHPGPKKLRMARSNFLVRLMTGFMVALLPNGTMADNSFLNINNLSETNEIRHINGKGDLKKHGWIRHTAVQKSPELARPLLLVSGYQASEVSERSATQRGKQTAMCSQVIRKDHLRPWWNASPTKDAEREAEESSPQGKTDCRHDSKKKVSVQKNRTHVHHGHRKPMEWHVREVPKIDLTEVKDPCDSMHLICICLLIVSTYVMKKLSSHKREYKNIHGSQEELRTPRRKRGRPESAPSPLGGPEKSSLG